MDGVLDSISDFNKLNVVYGDFNILVVDMKSAVLEFEFIVFVDGYHSAVFKINKNFITLFR